MKISKIAGLMLFLAVLAVGCKAENEGAGEPAAVEVSPTYESSGLKMRAPDLRGAELERAIRVFCDRFDSRTSTNRTAQQRDIEDFIKTVYKNEKYPPSNKSSTPEIANHYTALIRASSLDEALGNALGELSGQSPDNNPNASDCVAYLSEQYTKYLF